VCGTGDSFEMAQSATPYHVVDMEAYALALVAMKENIPFLSLKYIPDGDDGDAAEDWELQVHKTAAAFGKLLKPHTVNLTTLYSTIDEMNKDLILREKLALQRTILANQSTLLAFIRTSMYFLVAGISINNLTTVEYGGTIEMIFIGISVVLIAIGVFNYVVHKKKIVESNHHIGDYKIEYLDKKQ